MSSTPPALVTRYLALAVEQRTDDLVALFTPEATVVDEGEARRGTDAIRAWRAGAATAYEYTTTVTGHEPLPGGRHRVRVRLEGTFPGGTADLRFDFTLAGDRISRLEIAP